MATILIVDDDPKWRRAAAAALEARGHRVRLAPDGLEALDQLQHPPDLMFLDLVMPWIDGVKLLDEIRKATVPGCPVVVVSEDTTAATREMLADFNVTAVLGKPGLTPEVLAEAAQDVLGLATVGV